MFNPSKRAFTKRCWAKLTDRAADLRWEIDHAISQGVDDDDPGFRARSQKARLLITAADRLARKLLISNPNRKD